MSSGAPSPSEPARRDRIVIGGSEGSLRPLLSILSSLPRTLHAAVLVVLHRLAESRELSPLLATHCALPVQSARDGATIQDGVVYLAVPDLHLSVSDGTMRVLYGPRENLARPSIDVLFRSAAVEFGSRTVALILSGALDDGASGVSAVVRCGGHAIVQAPADASNAQLPEAALRMGPQQILPAAQIADALVGLTSQPAPMNAFVPADVAVEARAAAAAMGPFTKVLSKGEPTHLTCPECDGPLFRTEAAEREQYSCDVGHAFSIETLATSQAIALERALWVAFRALLERARLLEHMAEDSEKRGMHASESNFRRRAIELKEHSDAVLAALGTKQSP